ncbi:type I-E CRISPR-associated protein Cas7/Cse4/CasC [Streptomyces caniscabiei]|uniref:Type I-E CRISPR-associated protein Cas7/Cse4/CasC n=1 Tax=Streptomyces caniscabiei TaxID=2746961 RepID=A0ABU4N0D7_9ACTN|nr:type I-E CRISPR-associated protein Cas7/Cse4/CasC [Streptomyces caniscabiei]MBE4740573.1 type I-E CRISPR-associated protein Cas7/Cse4/CasC [Streptomyces caniscabiei]MBE4761025.1 type I-E CRISPR-associated protein Cas7/Cse4/CasC [Streptomyces caniscabiei]MBE4773535.1 type I-E CRISPR-associated protein Cas7/Cse4/CasC [Streptomyces caniscabiei]MBE4789767.1 type I-E CRISPR-associated protein Cas7/Cse4/CasC [Streptomyces caniscabiei]MBE4798951.1 type I-E CRISPR-associated protein Cas7/Cse4/CasC 
MINFGPGNLHVDLHLIQSYPYSNLNRDRQGAPKSARYGGVMRARNSSQNGKRHTRTAVERAVGIRALRTRGVPQAVAKRLAARGWQPELARAAGQMLILAAGVKGLGITDSGGTNALLFLPESALDELADLADGHRGDITQAVYDIEAEAAKAAKRTTRRKADADLEPAADDEEEPAVGEGSPLARYAAKILPKAAVLTILQSKNASVAAFGRMLANESGSIVDGAVQMAHGLSTHAASTQLDYFTAVDDILEEEGTERGAGHMGDQRYTSATFYRYTSLNVTELVRNLDGDTQTAQAVLAEFMRAFITTVLPAKASGTAPFTVPHLTYAALRSDRPVSLVGAYETPVPDSAEGYLPRSMQRLNDHARAHHRFLGTGGLITHAHSGLTDDSFDALGDRLDGLDELIARVSDTVTKELA